MARHWRAVAAAEAMGCWAACGREVRQQLPPPLAPDKQSAVAMRESSTKSPARRRPKCNCETQMSAAEDAAAVAEEEEDAARALHPEADEWVDKLLGALPAGAGSAA